MQNDAFPIGTQVIIWGRPETNLILLFGEGRYEGLTYVNGSYWPTIRLNNGREIVVHQQGVLVGQNEHVAATCQRFQGDVIEWDLDAYLRGEKPSAEQRVKSTPNSSAALPPPKTATDKVMYLKREIEMQEAKIKVAEKVIEDAKKIITDKRKEIGDMTQTVLNELATVNPGVLEMLAQQVADKLKAGQPAFEPPRVMADPLNVTVPVAAPPPVVVPVTKQDEAKIEQDSIKNATED